MERVTVVVNSALSERCQESGRTGLDDGNIWRMQTTGGSELTGRNESAALVPSPAFLFGLCNCAQLQECTLCNQALNAFLALSLE